MGKVMEDMATGTSQSMGTAMTTGMTMGMTTDMAMGMAIRMRTITAMVRIVVPLLRESIGILMQRTPPSLDHVLPECYQRVQQLQGVYNLQEPHFWTLCTDVDVGTLKLLVAPNADSRWILSQTHNIFTQVQQLQGVYNLQEPHFWTLCTDVDVGTLKLLVAPNADSRWILSQTHNIFTQVGR
ncbi:UNVERIFIED_CONTAM: hypothetical protein FKN15_053092 [Acipenser sinensis]